MDDWMRLEDVDLASIEPPEDLGPTPGDPTGRYKSHPADQHGPVQGPSSVHLVRSLLTLISSGSMLPLVWA